jgi:hypothetical protein
VPTGRGELILLKSAICHTADRICAVFNDQMVPLMREATGTGADADARAGLLSTHLLD